ncbi:MAG: hypothetical protein UT63_C0064G0025 [Candidatus Gottesmanbacteria bacterium GW2011_GWC2_39_8]|uniref:DUF5660 domain-containing protein n=1 Tax=Candidatus Gottesmanbacteria bacterium GW2011_GWC2_39_8 TaxID=1618450 RepID=A0A0G0PUT7_9BACT|nr:MAG: hypothetical protein UT63_C0064G0025 [Candidatus Gottesmanbacteria bacterium GW2011_GWC2_39_8]
MANTKKSNNRNQSIDSPEKIKDSSGGFSDLLKTVSPTGFIDQLFGKNQPKSEITKSWEDTLSPKEKSQKKSNEVVVYSFHAREKTAEQNEMQKEVQEILHALKQQVKLLEKSEKGLAKDLSKVTVESLPEKTGIYYLRFFEWLLVLIKQVRAKVEEGKTWLDCMQGKKKKGYWGMYKKHGTGFGLSNERSMATQAG